MSSRVCNVCGVLFHEAPQRNLDLFEKIPGGERCARCGRSQNWFGTAKQPGWWPSRLKTVESVERQWRWTHWTASLAVASLLLLFTVNIANSFIDADLPGGSDDKAFVPDMTGMNLQAAQDCLQELGFWLLDDQPAAGESRFQINDSNWTVTSQNVQGEVESTDVSIVLYARNTGGDGGQACP